MTSQRIGKYELVERLGEGGMAEVFRAKLPGAAGFEKTVVIKRIRPELAKKRDMVGMFVAEAKLAAQIIHQNIVQVFGLEEHEGELLMVLEYIDGTDLRRILATANKNRLRIPPWFAVRVMTEVLAGLGHAHELKDEQGRPRNVVHRDVSPSNIFVSKAGEVKLGDFGVAKDHSKRDTTVTGTIKGKLAYMSPEQLYHRALDQRSDVFAAGVVLWEVLAQRRLFGGKRPEIETMNLICSGERKPPSHMFGDVPPELDACVLRALRPHPSQRFLTARDFQNRLLEILQDLKPRIFPDDVRAIVQDVLRVTHGQPAGSMEPVKLQRSESQSDSGKSFVSSSGDVPVRGLKEHAVVFDVDVAEDEPLPARIAKYEGPHPFWIDDTKKVSGPLSYFDALVLARDRVRAGSPILLSPDGKTWVIASQFAELTGQEALFSEDTTRDLTTMPHGLLENRSVVSLLSHMTEQRASSRLTVVSEQSGREMRIEVLFAEGSPVFVSSNLFRLQLPEVLTAAGLVTSGGLPELFHRVLSTGEPLERFVAELDPSWTPNAIRLLLFKERLISLLAWRSGAFSIEEGVLTRVEPVAETILPLVGELVSSALSEAALMDVFAGRLDTTFAISRRFARGIAALGLDQQRFDIARALARGESIASLLESRPADVHAVLAVAYLLRETELLEPTARG
jgi:serine/threonine-protein kinase